MRSAVSAWLFGSKQQGRLSVTLLALLPSNAITPLQSTTLGFGVFFDLNQGLATAKLLALMLF
ncbi:hypothetical protein KJI95_06585 [Shewanella sp. JM162201]|uniref:Uncharacterized protein n=1 Tax=Shewanella jiangmenensis TaxID=2837387 RepID=A0ABS5V2Z6_9GAMM|nr:hypothetical protein [Shewanella jiangmenensis]MBT1444191.1 hypothetical protein [Shewanella jiangmenensis]